MTGSQYFKRADNRAYRQRVKRRMLEECLFMQSRGEWDGLVTKDLSEIPEGYAGLVLNVNDHGNVSLLRAFKNGATHSIAAIV